MAMFVIEGGKKLKGDIIPQGAKNEALQIISACLLTDKEVVVHNIPNILDVNNLIALLMELGVKVRKLDDSSYSFTADDINLDFAYSKSFLEKTSKLRGSVLILGPLLGRFGRAIIAKPGGDKIGRRRLDTHFEGFIKLGAHFEFDSKQEIYSIQADRLKGTYMLLDEASVTGTANIIMAAVLAEGVTTIYNAACEPYIQQLCKMLVRMGATISGIGSNLLTIVGAERLDGTTHEMLPDMIEVGSFIGMAAMTESEIRIKNACVKELGIIPDAFRKLGIRIDQEGDDLFIPSQDHYEIESFIA
uniref:UDP-N-acetylglucosamine 1-carboxyvinyltransferase n=1 Tax=Porphyromonas cangingivalis TaxID=36874 RepID=UPI00243328CE